MNWDKYIGHEAAVVLALAELREGGETIEAALASYDAWMTERTRGWTRPETARAKAAPPVRQPAGQADLEHLLGACPQCGAEVWGSKKCPHISPPWRTFFACDNDACGYHGKSRLTVEALRRRWPEGVEVE